ncbi:MAG TPA: cation:proton antiporter [Chloroflexota bacterium]|nr:cation:proton antiporter [Chloroflexota bacterium]
MPDLLTALALLAAVLTLSALVSGLIERAPISFPLLFLGIGVLLGERGLGLLHVGPHDVTLEAVATVSLALVLFLDAIKLRFDETGWVVPALILGPGTLLTIGLVAGAAYLLFALPPLVAVLLGAVLASTDPVVLRDVTRDHRIPRSVRRTLSVEAGTNDVAVLPIVLVLIALLRGGMRDPGDWVALLIRLFVVSPAVGFVVGGFGSWLMRRVDDRLAIRREYQALYGLGLVLASYAAGQALGGDGFLTAFAAGASVVVLNQELCDCFLEYGEVTAEMAMLLAFILFGALLSAMIAAGAAPLLPSLLLAAAALLVARPAAMGLVLLRASMSRPAKLFVAWFGPRGLSSLLLALLVVSGNVPDAERLLAIVGVVVIASVIVHGVSATPLTAWYGRHVERETLPEERGGEVSDLFSLPLHLLDHALAGAAPRITPADLAGRLADPAPPIVLDVRSRSSYAPEHGQIPGSVRVLPDEVADWAARRAETDEARGAVAVHGPPADGRARARQVVTYCT